MLFTVEQLHNYTLQKWKVKRFPQMPIDAKFILSLFDKEAAIILHRTDHT